MEDTNDLLRVFAFIEGILTEIQRNISVVYKLCSSFEIATDGFCVTI